MEQVFPIFIAVVVFVVIMALYFLYITSPKNIKTQNKNNVDLSIVKPKWAEIQAMMKNGGPANYRQAIMEADKLIDHVLKGRVSGESMGDRLKNSKHLFAKDTYNQLWLAHKIRNKVAHEADFEGYGHDANLAIRHFERALKELRVI